MRLTTRPTTHHATVCLAAMLAAALPLRAALAQGEATLGPRLQDATIEGHGSTLTIRRLPVRTPGGIVYRDITIQLQVDAAGALQAATAGGTATLRIRPSSGIAAAAPGAAIPAHDLSVGSITETATVPEVAAVFLPGRYRSDSGAMLELRSIGTGLLGGQFTSFQISTVFGDNAFSSAAWYAGPIRTSPYRRRLANANITDPGYSYGVVDGSGVGHFDAGMLVGAVQKGNALTIVSFHRHGCCTYAESPTSAVSYTRVGN